MSEPRSAALHGDAALIRAVGFFALTAAVINVIVGGGIFRLPASIAGHMGTAAPIAFVVGALVIIPITLCFAAAGSRVSSTGGPYTYVDAAFGSFAGFVAGALMWLGNVASAAGIATGLVDHAAHAWPVLGEFYPRAFALAGLELALILLNAFGVRMGARAIVALATLKLTPLFVLAAVGLFFVDWGQVSFGGVPSWSALGASMIMVIFAYSGIETALIPSGEVRDPARDVPRAALAATALVVLLYVSIQIVAQGVLGPRLPGSTAPLAETAGAIWSPGYTLLLVTASISMTGFLMGNLLGSSRIVYALARDGFMPRQLAAITPKHRVPLAAIITHGSIACALAIYGSFDFLVIVSGGANCLVYVGVAAAAWQLQRSGRADHGSAFVMRGGALVPVISIVAMVAILATLKRDEWLAIGVALAALVVVYALLRALRARGAAQPPASPRP